MYRSQLDSDQFPRSEAESAALFCRWRGSGRWQLSEEHPGYRPNRAASRAASAPPRIAVTGPLDVQVRSASDWERAIIRGFELFRDLVAHDGGFIDFDADAGVLAFRARST